MPALRAEDERLLDCFVLCDTQLRVSFGGVYALDWNVVTEVARAMGIYTDRTFYVLLKTFESTMIPELKKKTKQESEEQSEREL